MHSGLKQNLECALYVVATPIGNLRDITLRALDVLSSVDVIAAEDTRNTTHLLHHHQLKIPRLLALHQHNEHRCAEAVIKIIQSNQSVAFVSDAGTPAISDPGAILVQAVRAAHLKVIPLPGANAAISALSASGFTQPQFYFYGFLPNRASARRSVLHLLQPRAETLIFYEAPHRIEESLTDLGEVLGQARRVVVAREVSKLFEQIHACTLGEALPWLNENEFHRRGEFVLLVEGKAIHTDALSAEAEQTLQILLTELPLKQAVQLCSKISGLPKNALYQRALELQAQSTAQGH